MRVNQCLNPLKRSPRLKPDGYGPGKRCAGTRRNGREPGSRRRLGCVVRGRVASGRVIVTTSPQGKSWAPTPPSDPEGATGFGRSPGNRSSSLDALLFLFAGAFSAPTLQTFRMLVVGVRAE